MTSHKDLSTPKIDAARARFAALDRAIEAELARPWYHWRRWAGRLWWRWHMGEWWW